MSKIDNGIKMKVEVDNFVHFIHIQKSAEHY